MGTIGIKNPKFKFLHNDSKVYYISKMGACFGRNKYFTVPVELRTSSSFTNCLVGYTSETLANKTLLELSACAHTRVHHTSCKDLHYISTVLRVPLVVVMDTDTDTQTIYFKPN